MLADQWHKGHRDDPLDSEVLSISPPALEDLAVTSSNGEHQPALKIKLVQQRPRHSRGGGSHDDPLVWSELGEPTRAVSLADCHVFNLEPLKHLPRQPGQFGRPFDGIHLPRQPRQHRCLIPRARAHLKDRLRAYQFQELGHQSDDVRLRDRLSLTDREWAVRIGKVPRLRRDEQVPGHCHHRLEHARVSDVALAQLFIHHSPSGGKVVGLAHVPPTSDYRSSLTFSIDGFPEVSLAFEIALLQAGSSAGGGG